MRTTPAHRGGLGNTPPTPSQPPPDDSGDRAAPGEPTLTYFAVCTNQPFRHSRVQSPTVFLCSCFREFT